MPPWQGQVGGPARKFEGPVWFDNLCEPTARRSIVCRSNGANTSLQNRMNQGSAAGWKASALPRQELNSRRAHVWRVCEIRPRQSAGSIIKALILLHFGEWCNGSTTAFGLIPSRRVADSRLGFPNQMRTDSSWQTEEVCHGSGDWGCLLYTSPSPRDS